MYWYLVLMSPEVATTAPWRGLFTTDYYKRHLVLVAVDEAHCIHEWLDDYSEHIKCIYINLA